MKLILPILLITGMLITACNNATDGKATKLQEAPIPLADAEIKTETSNVAFNAIATDSIDAPAPPQNDDKQKQASPPKNPLPERTDWNKKIVKTGDLLVEVKDYNKYYLSLREKVKNLGGYIAQENQSQSEYKIENSLTIKVPVDQFDNAVMQLSENTDKILERKVSSQDVTAEVIDTKSRLESKKLVRVRYLDLMKQAKNMEEVLQVEKEVNHMQEEIESATGRINYLYNASSMSTIQLNYFQILNESAKVDSAPSFGTKLASALSNGLSWISGLVIGLISIWPLYLFIFIAILIYKKVKPAKTK